MIGRARLRALPDVAGNDGRGSDGGSRGGWFVWFHAVMLRHAEKPVNRRQWGESQVCDAKCRSCGAGCRG